VHYNPVHGSRKLVIGTQCRWVNASRQGGGSIWHPGQAGICSPPTWHLRSVQSVRDHIQVSMGVQQAETMAPIVPSSLQAGRIYRQAGKSI